MKFVYKELEKLIDIFDKQRIPLSSIEREKKKGEYPYYGASGIIDYIDEYIFDGEYVLVSEDGENLRSRKTPIIFKAKGKFWVNNHAHIIKGKENILNDNYLIYVFNNTNISGYITGAAQPKLTQENLCRISIPLPEKYCTQLKIAKILSNYDDLIENNNKRIKILEDMAQKIYKEWFVDFKYPGHETATFKDTELGKIPRDWDIKTLDNFCNIFTGKKNANAAVNKGMYKFFTCAPDPLSIDTYIYDGKAIIIAGNGSYTGRTQFFDGKFDLYQRTYACTLQDSYDEYLIYALFVIMKEKFEKKVMGGMHGAAIPYIVYDDIAKYTFAYNDNIFTNFSMIMKIYIESIFLLKQKNIQLKQTRDLLLPRLLSGEIDVEHMEIN